MKDHVQRNQKSRRAYSAIRLTSVTSFAAAPAPTMPTATTWRSGSRRGVIMSPAPPAPTAPKRKHAYQPPGNNPVPTSNAFSPLRQGQHASARSYASSPTAAGLSGRAATSFGINRFAATTCASVGQRAGNQRGDDMPVGQYAAARDGTEQNRAAIVEASIRPLAFTSLSPVVSSPRIPYYFAGE